MLTQSFLNILCCPKRLCRGDLKEVTDKGRNLLSCKECHASYQFAEGIPLLFPNEQNSRDTHKRHWDQEKHAKSYAKKYDGYLKKQGTPWGLYTHSSELRAIKRLTISQDMTRKTIIDLGCGNGRLLSSYPEAGIKIGFDASLTLLLATKEREPDFWLVCGQVEDLPFKDATFDFSVSIRVFQHLRAPDEAFAEMVRVTKPNGHIALEVYNKLNLKELYKRLRMTKFMQRVWPWGLTYDRYYSYRDIERWCRKTFVRPITFTGAGWGFFFYFFEPIQFRYRAPKLVQRWVYNTFLYVETVISTLPFFSLSVPW